MKDPELRVLLIQELTRHRAVLEGDDLEASRRSLHALKGSAAIAGERDLASAFERLQRRVREGATEAITEAVKVAATAIRRMENFETPVETHWPEPPDDLVPRALDPLVLTQYVAEVKDRLARIDEALASPGDETEAARVVYRQVHTVKGAASAVGDEVMSWFCHGLEEQLRVVKDEHSAGAMLREMPRYRSLLAALLDDAHAALAMLRAPNTRVPSEPPTESPPRDAAPRAVTDEATIRVSAASVDRLLGRFEAIELVRERMVAQAEGAQDQARMVRVMRVQLAEALRLIGPPRPWGAPAAALRHIDRVASELSAIEGELDRGATLIGSSDQTLRESVTDAKKQLSAMRQTPLRRIFERLSLAIEAEARRIDRVVVVRARGSDETIDRRLAELLVEPFLQLARNSVAHGIEPPEVRMNVGKSPSATVGLTAKRVGNRLSVTIEDDGAGVDVAGVREQALSLGLITPEIAEAADDDTLLTLLFLPGFSTRSTSDLLAGRGIGLDLARASIQKMGGTIRLTSRKSQGFSARVDVPVESGFGRVLWVMASGELYALPVMHVAGVRINDRGERLPHLTACLEPRLAPRPVFAVELLVGDTPEEGMLSVGVDAVVGTEEILVRPLPPLIAGLGPFAGGIVRGDGAVRLAIDVHGLAPRVRALAQVTEGKTSDAPRRASVPV